MSNAEIPEREAQLTYTGFEEAIEIIQRVESLAGDIEPGDVSAMQVVKIERSIRQISSAIERKQVAIQIGAMVGIGSFRAEFNKDEKKPA